MDKVNIGWEEVDVLATPIATQIKQTDVGGIRCLYGVPNGGIYAAMAVQRVLTKQDCLSYLVEDPHAAHFIIDDVIGSGATHFRFQNEVIRKSDIKFLALIDKKGKHKDMGWAVWPWERMMKTDGIEDNIRRILEFIGEDANREGLKDTPRRVVKSYSELFSGYKQKVEDVMTVFEDGACDSVVILKDVEFFSTCEHHCLPFFGKAHIAYIPNGKVIGISKLARILEIYSRRLQVQERLTEQVTKALDDHLKPKGSACILEAVHSCMTCRGVNKQHSKMITSSLTGEFLKSEVRAELFQLIRG